MSEDGRQDIDHFCMDLAQSIARHSSCPTGRSGAVLFNEGVRAVGWSGAPAGIPSCLDLGGCDLVGNRCARGLHAEANLLLFSDRKDRDGSTIYILQCPCWDCANLIANSGVAEVVVAELADDSEQTELVLGLFDLKRIIFRQLNS